MIVSIYLEKSEKKAGKLLAKEIDRILNEMDDSISPESYRVVMSKCGKVAVAPKQKFTLGVKLRDVVTGFEGIATAYIQHLTGCDTYGITPPMDDKGKLPSSCSFDVSRLIEIGPGITADDAWDPPSKDKDEKVGAGEVSLEKVSDY